MREIRRENKREINRSGGNCYILLDVSIYTLSPRGIILLTYSAGDAKAAGDRSGNQASAAADQ